MNRYEVIMQLLQEEERANADFAMGQSAPDAWAKTIQLIDERLSVLGVRLANVPITRRELQTPAF